MCKIYEYDIIEIISIDVGLHDFNMVPVPSCLYDSYMNISSKARCILHLVYELRWCIQMFIQLKPITPFGRFEPSSRWVTVQTYSVIWSQKSIMFLGFFSPAAGTQCCEDHFFRSGPLCPTGPTGCGLRLMMGNLGDDQRVLELWAPVSSCVTRITEI